MPKVQTPNPQKKAPVAGKSGKEGVTANFRGKDEPKPIQVPGKFQPH
jgi:hypothetical protein